MYEEVYRSRLIQPIFAPPRTTTTFFAAARREVRALGSVIDVRKYSHALHVADVREPPDAFPFLIAAIAKPTGSLTQSVKPEIELRIRDSQRLAERQMSAFGLQMMIG
jgi:hypothetical protein